jgi:hypothetical protein
MEGKFSINGNQVAYLIHGQPVSLNYEINRCWFVLLIHDTGRGFFRKFHFKRSKGVFETVSNVYSPTIRLVAFGLGIRRFKFDLEINFINCMPLPFQSMPLPQPVLEKPVFHHHDIRYQKSYFVKTHEPVLTPVNNKLNFQKPEIQINKNLLTS